MARIEIGKHLAADTRVCRGRLIFKGTRILVSDALELTKAGYTPEAISRQYRGIVTAKGVREALALTLTSAPYDMSPLASTQLGTSEIDGRRFLIVNSATRL